MHLTKYLYKHELDNNTLLLMNTLSGAVDIVKGKDIESLDHISKVMPKHIQDENFLSALRKRGYLFSSIEEETDILLHIKNIFCTTAKNLPLIYISPTYQCNLKCIYCNEWDIPKVAKQRVMSQQQINQAFNCILKILRETKFKDDNINIILFGGEPLMPTTYSSVEQIFEKSRKHSFRVTIITNGTYIEHFMPILGEYRDILGDFVITLDGTSHIHDKRRKYANGSGTFKRIVRGIEALLKSGFSVRIQSILDSHNLPNLPELGNFIIEKGWHNYKNFSIGVGKVMFPLGNKNREYSYLLSEADLIKEWFPLRRKIDCLKVFDENLMGDLQVFYHLHKVFEKQKNKTFPKLSGCAAIYPGIYAFGPDGFIYPCAEVVGRNDFAIGSFSEKIVWFDNREAWKNWNVWDFEKCSHCKFITLCGGGCPLNTIRPSARVNEPVCPDVENIISSYIDSRKDELFAEFL